MYTCVCLVPSDQQCFSLLFYSIYKKNIMTIHNDEFKIPIPDSGLQAEYLRPFSVIVASEVNGGIGFKDNIPWSIPEDMNFFRAKTTNLNKKSEKLSETLRNAVIMGRKTWESIRSEHLPLRNRLNVILSSTKTAEELLLGTRVEQTSIAEKNCAGNSIEDCSDVLVVSGGLCEALKILAKPPYASQIQTVYCIGGATVYDQASQPPAVNVLQNVFHTLVRQSFPECDAFLSYPFLNLLKMKNGYSETESTGKVTGFANGEESHLQNSSVEFVLDNKKEVVTSFQGGVKIEFQRYVRRNKEEEQYLDLIRDILANGIVKGDRTGTGTKSVFGRQMRFSLRNGMFPLLTTKRVFWRGVCEELFFFLNAETDSKILQKKGIHIWDKNSSREYLDKVGLTEYEDGELGPVYGFQWRHFGATYAGIHQDYDNQGVDQVKQLVNMIRRNPSDRRLILSAWNPAALHDMVLPPCHMFAQFYVNTDTNELSCQMYQRSCDVGLGVPFNIASYALLTNLIAKATNLVPGELIHILGDAHIYLNHVETLEEELRRVPRAFPMQVFYNVPQHLEDFKLEDVGLLDYDPLSALKMEMSA